MSLSDLNDLLLTYVVTYGAVVLALVFCLAAMGVPLPSTLFVVAAGAFVQQGCSISPQPLRWGWWLWCWATR